MFSFQKACHHVDCGAVDTGSIPLIDISPLFNAASGDRDRADRQIAEAAADVGFFGARGWSANLPIDEQFRRSAARTDPAATRECRAGMARMSVPFFYESRVDAVIRPLPMDPADAFAPFLYGDYLWSTTTQFVEFNRMEELRKPVGLRAG